MTDMQRWDYDDLCAAPLKFRGSEWVTYSDHVEALRQAEQRTFAKCIAAVEAEHPRGVRWWADWLFWSKFRRSLVTFGYDWHKHHALETLRILALRDLQEKS